MLRTEVWSSAPWSKTLGTAHSSSVPPWMRMSLRSHCEWSSTIAPTECSRWRSATWCAASGRWQVCTIHRQTASSRTRCSFDGQPQTSRLRETGSPANPARKRSGDSQANLPSVSHVRRGRSLAEVKPRFAWNARLVRLPYRGQQSLSAAIADLFFDVHVACGRVACAGYFQPDERQFGCIGCDSIGNFYQELSAQTLCIACPQNSQRYPGVSSSGNKSACLCKAGDDECDLGTIPRYIREAARQFALCFALQAIIAQAIRQARYSPSSAVLSRLPSDPA
jgi:hypothetical protein